MGIFWYSCDVDGIDYYDSTKNKIIQENCNDTSSHS